MAGDQTSTAAAEALPAQLAGLQTTLTGIEDRLVAASRRVAEADGRLDRELDRVQADVSESIQRMRDDIAATVHAMEEEVERRLAAADPAALAGRIEALERRLDARPGGA